MRAPVFLTALIAASAVAASAAWACSCVRYASAAQQLAEADVMFVGRATSLVNHAYGDDRGGSHVVTRFDVVRTIKGEPYDSIPVTHSTTTGGMCGIRFALGETHIVIAHRDAGGALVTNSCNQPQFPLADYERAAGR